MKLYELMDVVSDGTRMKVYEIDECTELTRYDGKESIDERYNNLDVVNITVNYETNSTTGETVPYLVVNVELPMFEVRGTVETEVCVHVRALSEEDAMDKVGDIYLTERYSTIEVEGLGDADVEWLESGRIEWDEAEEV